MKEPPEARVLEIFGDALEVTAAERGAWLESACGGDPAVRAAVEALLAADARGHAAVDAPYEDLLGLLEDADGPAHERIGAWRIVRELGRGGMGVVYLADRDDDEFTRRAALKVIRPGPDTNIYADRFLRERQILADLDHPHIARLLDGGHTPDGLPYLVMEYVEGEPIDVWCRNREFSIEDRLRLFLDVCDAVQHAHQSLIVHRDLKPAHVLVTERGGIKLLDFGIARLVEEGVGEDATRTMFQAFTPRYASPEQLTQRPVTTAADVWALGVMLYELLTDRSPFTGGDAFATARAVVDADPVPPGRVVGDHRERVLRGDLDAIVLRALRKDPKERYASAAALRDDIERFLRHEPVVARAEGPLYRGGKFIRRHRAAVATTAAVLVLAAAAGLVHNARITRERDRAELEARKAGEVRDFLLGLFNSNLPSQALGEELSVRDLLERGVARTDSLADQPELRALLLTTLGDVYRVLGRFDEAERLLAGALAAYEAMPASPPLDHAGALTSMAMLHFDLDRHDEALAPTRQALEIRRRELGADHPDVLSAMGNLATLTAHTGSVEESLRLQLELLALRRRVLAPDDPQIGITLNNIGTLFYRQERYDEAERYFAEALDLRRRALPAAHPDVMLSMNNLASLYRAQDRLDEAEPLYREALELRRQVFGEVHPGVALSHYHLGQVLRMRGEPAAAREHFTAALDIDRSVYGPDHVEVGVDAFQVGVVAAEADDCEGALEAWEEARRVFRLAGDAATERLARTELAAGDCEVRRGRPTEAERRFLAVLELLPDSSSTPLAEDARTRLRNLGAAAATPPR